MCWSNSNLNVSTLNSATTAAFKKPLVRNLKTSRTAESPTPMSSSGRDLSPGQPHLPPELIHCIIENCDKECLPNFSLVSQTWHSITAPLLYSHFTVRFDGWGGGLSELIGFLQEGTRLARHVKSLKVVNGHLDVYQSTQIFGYFPHLQDLAMEETDVTPVPRATLTSIPHDDPSLPIPHLKSLMLLSIDVFHCGDPWLPLFDLINSFSVIDKLVVETLWSRHYRGPRPDRFTNITPGGKAKIGELVFTPELDKNVEEFVDAMAEHLDVTQVHTLETVQWCERNFFRQVMAMFGSVKHLRFLLGQYDVLGYYTCFPASLSSLESITFSTRLFWTSVDAGKETLRYSRAMFSSSIESLSTISEATGAQLSTIRYEFGEGLVESGNLDGLRHLKQVIADVEWSNLQSILNKSTFRKLRLVEVLLVVSDNFPDDPPDGMSVAECRAKKDEGRVALVDLVKKQFSNFAKGYTVNVLTRDG